MEDDGRRLPIKALTALRFPAALMIVVVHMRMVDIHVFNGWPLDYGVSFFFMLSGFILTYVYPVLDGRPEIQTFIIARIARLWPVHFAMIALTCFLVGAHYNVWIWTLNVTMTQAWMPMSMSFFSFNSPSWSISTELFFYLMFPFLIQNLSRTWWWKLALSFLAACGMIALTAWLGLGQHTAMNYVPTSTGLLYINPISRIFEFITGMCLAVAYNDLRPRLTVSTFIATVLEVAAVSVFIINAAYVDRITEVIRHTLGNSASTWAAHSVSLYVGTALLIFVMALQRGYVSRALGCRLGVTLGEVSFSIYMLHYILLLYWARHKGAISQLPTSLQISAYMTLLMAGSFALWRGFERPMRNLIILRLKTSPSLVLLINAEGRER